ncbi:hypothetical protein AK812_SmicGene44599 [Symbiodinium microadriaticum]|uniref:Uncharacterized protein n=1 Tax=Symbiodinium microadriaticum TaxID=2951 RepID=A0A1Q9BY23_SYMMI|nr:hypothetical protein AK812_SmicGene44599 [Symbiodinium microadriaticum]
MFCVRIEKLVAKIKDSLDKDQLHPQADGNPSQAVRGASFVSYADAYITFQFRDAQPSAGCEMEFRETCWTKVSSFPHGQRLAFRSEVPKEILSKTVTSEAFIFWLEMLAQVLANLTVAENLKWHLLFFVDSTRAHNITQHELNIGYSKDVFLLKFWGASRFLSVQGITLSLQRVTSAADVQSALVASSLTSTSARVIGGSEHSQTPTRSSGSRSSPPNWARREWRNSAHEWSEPRCSYRTERPRAGPQVSKFARRKEKSQPE